MNSKNNQHLITKGIKEDLKDVQFHGPAPFDRILMSGKGTVDFKMHIAVHEISKLLDYQQRNYSIPHRHNCDEWNILTSQEYLKFEIFLDNVRHVVDAPATIYIPAGTLHSANVLEGTGHFIALVNTQDYPNSFIEV